MYLGRRVQFLIAGGEVIKLEGIAISETELIVFGHYEYDGIYHFPCKEMNALIARETTRYNREGRGAFSLGMSLGTMRVINEDYWLPDEYKEMIKNKQQ